MSNQMKSIVDLSYLHSGHLEWVGSQRTVVGNYLVVACWEDTV